MFNIKSFKFQSFRLTLGALGTNATRDGGSNLLKRHHVMGWEEHVTGIHLCMDFFKDSSTKQPISVGNNHHPHWV